jgi:hypothetical protein
MIARSLLSHRVRAAFAALILLSLVTQARAHFLFIRIGPPAEAGRSAEVFFSEQAEAGDPKFVGKIAHTTLWIQTRPGEFRELPTKQAADRLRASLPSDRTLAVVGKCEYGVLARPKETPFLLRYYPKAVAGNADELNRLKPNREIPFEIQANFENQATNSDKTAAGRIRLVALRNGKVVPNALFTAVDSDLSEQTIKADSDGSARWSPAAPGRYSVYVRDTLKEPGVLGDKKYDEIREFATLALNWPLERHDADSNATALFKEAIAHRAEWREFPGFTAELSGHVDGRPFAGTATVKNNGAVEIQTDDPVAKSWLQDQLDSLVMHRIAQASESADAHQPRLRFADDDDDHPLGRLLAVDGDQMGSSYRIKNQQITVVNRRMGKQNMTITVLDSDKNADGRFLPHSYVVHYWDAATGKLNRVETFQERSLRVGSWDLPVLRSIVTASDSGLSVKVVNLSKHALVKTN